MPEPDSRTAQSPFTTALVAVLGTIGTGVGVLGFLTFIGGATWLARYRGAGLSGTYGISVLPRSELLATGADQLFGPAIAALAAASVALAALGLATWWQLERRTWIGVAVVLVLAGIGFALGYLFEHEVGPPLAVRVRTPFAGAVLACLLGGALVVALAARAHNAESAVRAIAFALAVAGAVLLYGAFETYARNLAHPELRPVAIVEASGQGFAGYYVGRDANAIYVGVTTPRLPHSSGPRSNARVVRIAVTPGLEMAIGSTFAPPSAERLANDLLHDLRAAPAS